MSIPYWDTSCGHAAYAVLRTVCPRRHIPRRKEWRPKGVASPLWREHLLASGLEEVLVAEGPIDAIALESRLGLPTMALGGTGLAKRLARVVGDTPEELRPHRVLLALDDDKAGHTCASSLAEELWALGVPCAGLPGYAGHKDPDDWLMAECGQTWSYHEEPWPGLRVPRRTIAWAEGEDGEKARNPYDMASVRELARANLRASTRAAS